jgi:hypothetical protein
MADNPLGADSDPDFQKWKAANPVLAAPVADAPASAVDPEFDAWKKANVAPPEESMLTRVGKGLARGVGNMVGDVGEALAGPFGPRKDFARLMHDTGLSKEEPQVEAPYGAQIAKNLGIDSAKPGYAGSIAESVGNPLSYIGPGGPIPKLLMAAGSGAGGEAGEDLAHAAGFNPTAGRVVGSLIGGPLAARGAAPRVGADQRALLDAGMTEMTPGQLGGGWLKSLEDKATSFPILGEFIQNARGQSVRGFNRAVGNQALEPINERLASGTAAGHDTITEVGRKLGAAYDQLVPNLHFVPDYDFAHDIAQLRTDARTMPRSTAQQFERILNDRLHPDRWVQQQLLPPNMPNPGNLPAVRSPPIWGLQGQQFKQVESELTNLAGKYTKSSDAGQQQLGEALNEVVRAMRANIQRVNPDHAAELARINTGWAMFARMRDAAARRSTSEGVFTPNDLLNAIKRGDKSAGKGAFARGDALMQDFAEVGQRVLPSTVPDSGTTGRMLMAGALGGTSGHMLAQALHRPEILGGIGAAMGLYTRPSTWLLNHYANAPAGGVRDSLAQAGRGAGMAVPFLNQPSPFAEGGIVARRVRTQASRPRTTAIPKDPSPFQQRTANPFTT